MESLKLAGNAKISSAPCRGCDKRFIWFPAHTPGNQEPRRCPACADIAQERPSVVQERRQLAEYLGVEIVSLPGEWEEIPVSFLSRQKSFRISCKGKEFGADWNGRIDIFAYEPLQVGDIVSLREMEAVHKVRRVKETRQTMHHGEVAVERRLHVTAEQGEEVVEARRYLFAEKAKAGTTATTKLVWATAHTKTTLKGLGRQYWSSISGCPVAQWSVKGGVRSGRAHTTGVLAIVGEHNPLTVTTTGDVQEEQVYN